MSEFETGWVVTLAFAPDNDHLIVGEFGGSGASIWNFRTKVRTWNSHLRQVLYVGYIDKSNSMIIAGGARGVWERNVEGNLQLWRYHPYSPKLEKEFSGNRFVDCIAVSQDQEYLAAGSWEGNDRNGIWTVYNLDRMEQQTEVVGHSHRIRSLAFVPRSNSLVSGSSGELKIWDFKKGIELGMIPTQGEVTETRFFSRREGELGLLLGITPTRLQRRFLNRDLILHLNWIDTRRDRIAGNKNRVLF